MVVKSKAVKAISTSWQLLCCRLPAIMEEFSKLGKVFQGLEKFWILEKLCKVLGSRKFSLSEVDPCSLLSKWRAKPILAREKIYYSPHPVLLRLCWYSKIVMSETSMKVTEILYLIPGKVMKNWFPRYLQEPCVGASVFCVHLVTYLWDLFDNWWYNYRHRHYIIRWNSDREGCCSLSTEVSRQWWLGIMLIKKTHVYYLLKWCATSHDVLSNSVVFLTIFQ